jgi:hypothetical protein
MTIPVYINILMRRGIKTKALVRKERNQAKGKKVAGGKGEEEKKGKTK